MAGRMRHVRAEGTPREVGLQHGTGARDLIRANLELYFHRFEEEWGLPREEVLERARRYEGVIRDVDEPYAEAMEGVAEGSGQDLLDIVALNVRYEIAYSEYSKLGRMQPGRPPPSGCTALALLPSRTREGGLLMAQNWDWISGVKGMVVQSRIDGGPEILAFTEAGIVGGKIGLNAHGLGLLINGLLSDRDGWERLGMPFHVRCWRVLQAGTLEEAARHVRRPPASCSGNFLLGQVREGRAELLDLESCPVGTEELRPADGVLTHANHFHRADALGIWEPLMRERTSTFHRQRRLDHLLEGGRGESEKVGVEDVKRLLGDHDGRPNSICRHPETDLPREQWYETIVSVILDLSGGRMLISGGGPCESEYVAFALDG
jgi:isopenicillin-N N-acyltransferase-like protein